MIDLTFLKFNSLELDKEVGQLVFILVFNLSNIGTPTYFQAKMAGRPSSKFEINLKQIEESLKKIETLSSHPSIRENLKLFSSKLVNLCSTFKETGTQTDDCTEDNRALTEDNILDDVLSLKDESMGFIMQNIWQNLKKDDREPFLYDFYKSQTKQDQCKFLLLVSLNINDCLVV